MKKIIAILLTAALVISASALSSCNCTSSSDGKVEVQTPTEPQLKDEYGVGYIINADGTLAVTKYDGDDMDVSIPLDYEDKPVRNVAQSAFKGLDIETVTMPDGMKSIDDYAFALCKKLEVANIPEGVTDIGKNAFFGTFALTEVELPQTLETLGINAFNASGLEEIVIPKNVKSIGDYAFAGCKSLTKIKVLSKDTKVTANAFSTGAKTKVIAPKGSSAIKAAKKNNLKYKET